jgi:PIN domain nuclease of toxin-antitoxin system
VEVLLDTHAFIWWLAGDRALSDAAKTVIADPANDIFVSAASAWEISTKHRLGKLPRAALLAADVASAIASQGFVELPILVRHGQLAGNLPPPQRDPFDRMLIAQSLLGGMTLVSNEAIFDQYGVSRVW